MSTMAYSPIPGVAGLGQAQDSAKLAYQRALAKIGAQRQSTLHGYGYTADYGQDGSFSNMRVDPNNPYGNLQQMLRSQAGEDRLAGDQMEERGLHGGLANQAQSELHYNHGAQSAQLGMGLTNTLSDLTNQQYGAQEEYNNTLYQNELDAARNAIDQQNFTPADYSGLDYGPYSDVNTPSDNFNTMNPSTGQKLPTGHASFRPPVPPMAKPGRIKPKVRPKPHPKAKVVKQVMTRRYVHAKPKRV